MQQVDFDLEEKMSVSLMPLIDGGDGAERVPAAALSIGFAPRSAVRLSEEDRVPVLIRAEDSHNFLEEMGNQLAPRENLQQLSTNYFTARVGSHTLRELVAHPATERVQTKKRSIPHLDSVLAESGIFGSPIDWQARHIEEDGAGVVIGIVDTGFDLSHPMFYDTAGRLRVAALLDQTAGSAPGRVFRRENLQNIWAKRAATLPGIDTDGHGTHVAAIAGGSQFRGKYEGIAPKAEYLLVKTDFVNWADAVAWIFREAGRRPCVVNLSLGNHFGAHDGSSAEERILAELSGAGKVVVVSAGNECEDAIHVGGQFTTGQIESFTFDVLRPAQGAEPEAVFTMWHDISDTFTINLLTPLGQAIEIPPLGQGRRFQANRLTLMVARKHYKDSNPPNGLTQVQIELRFRDSDRVTDRDLRGWQISVRCDHATVGRMDGWFQNPGYAQFRYHSMVENKGTIGMPGTGDGVLTVASHVSRTDWDSDDGAQRDSRLVVGRISTFSSQGPTRDGRQKPDISAPGQYIISALAADSAMARIEARANATAQTLVLEGTSMATPVVTGAIALLLQKKRSLTTAQIRNILQMSARRDAHTGVSPWTASYGFGKLDIAAALRQIP